MLTAKIPWRTTGARGICCSASSTPSGGVSQRIAARPSFAHRLTRRPPSKATRSRAANAIQATTELRVAGIADPHQQTTGGQPDVSEDPSRGKVRGGRAFHDAARHG